MLEERGQSKLTGKIFRVGGVRRESTQNVRWAWVCIPVDPFLYWKGEGIGRTVPGRRAKDRRKCVGRDQQV